VTSITADANQSLNMRQMFQDQSSVTSALTSANNTSALATHIQTCMQRVLRWIFTSSLLSLPLHCRRYRALLLVKDGM
jgi:hypothetical protein